MVTIHLDPPGARGRKVEYWRTKPRHRLLVPILLFNTVAAAVSGYFAWRAASVGVSILAFVMAVATALFAVIIWRRGVRDRRDKSLRSPPASGGDVNLPK